MNNTARAALARQLGATPSPAPRPAADVVDPAAHTFRARVTPRYVGSIAEVHGDVADVRACVLPCCIELPEDEHPHVSLTVYPDAGGRAVRLDRVRFASFTGRPQ